MKFDPVPLLPFLVPVAAAWFLVALPGVRSFLADAVRRQPAVAFLPALVLLLSLCLCQALSGQFDRVMMLKAALYWTVPLLLAGFGRRDPEVVTWRDYAAAVAFFLPVHLRWFGKYNDLVEVIPAASVPLAVFYMVVVRGFPDPGYTWRVTRADVRVAVRNFLLFGLVALPLGFMLKFIKFHPTWKAVAAYPFAFLGVLLIIALPEELLFRGFLQTGLERTLGSRARGLALATLIFGLSHWNHPPVPNWRYVILATLAGLAYGQAYQARRRLPAAAITHALVDTTWFLFLAPGKFR